MEKRNFTLVELQLRLDALYEGAVLQIAHRDYERLFGVNDVAMGRLRRFAKGHACAASFADGPVLFRKKIQSAARGGSPPPLKRTLL